MNYKRGQILAYNNRNDEGNIILKIIDAINNYSFTVEILDHYLKESVGQNRTIPKTVLNSYYTPISIGKLTETLYDVKL